MRTVLILVMISGVNLFVVKSNARSIANNRKGDTKTCF